MGTGISTKIDNFLSLDRGSQILTFRTGVSNGMHSVSFHNTGAARDMSFGQDSYMSASASFGLASATSGEKSSFCENILADMKNDLHRAQLAMELSVSNQLNSYYGAVINSGIQDPQQRMLMNQQNDKKLEAETKLQRSLQDAYGELSESIKTLDDFNSDADVRFKNLKNAADNQEVMARKQYYNYVNTSSTGKASAKPFEMEANDEKEKKKNDDKAENTSGGSTNGMRMFGSTPFSALA